MNNVESVKTFSDAILSYLNLTEHDVVSNPENMIVRPEKYKDSAAVTVDGVFLYGIMQFNGETDSLYNYMHDNFSLCAYYKKNTPTGITNITISQSIDGSTIDYVNKTIIANNSWVCVLLSEKMLMEYYDKYHDIRFTVKPYDAVDPNKNPFLEMYPVDVGSAVNAITIKYELNCTGNCRYTLKDSNITTYDALHMEKLSNRRKRQIDVMLDPNIFSPYCCHNHVDDRRKHHDRHSARTPPAPPQPRPVPPRPPSSPSPPPPLPDKRILHTKECALHYKYISFKDVGCNWVLSPKGFTFRYCKGECIVSSFTKSSIVYGAMLVNDAKSSNIHICCSPKSRTSMRIMYAVGSNIRESTIHNFMPSSCGC